MVCNLPSTVSHLDVTSSFSSLAMLLTKHKSPSNKNNRKSEDDHHKLALAMEIGSSNTISSRLSRIGSFGSFLLSGILLLSYHVCAESGTSFDSQRHPWSLFWDRLNDGPDALTTLDKLLFGALMLLAFEVLDFISKHSGCELTVKMTIPYLATNILSPISHTLDLVHHSLAERQTNSRPRKTLG